jgi:hypothetical protein
MRAPILRSPIVLAAVALAIGLSGKLVLGAQFPVGWTMVALLWLLPILGIIVTIDDYLPGGWGSQTHGPGFFSSRENRLELLAILTLPGIGFAIDAAALLPHAVAFAVAGVIGILACAQLVRIERIKRAPGA